MLRFTAPCRTPLGSTPTFEWVSSTPVRFTLPHSKAVSTGTKTCAKDEELVCDCKKKVRLVGPDEI